MVLVLALSPYTAIAEAQQQVKQETVIPWENYEALKTDKQLVIAAFGADSVMVKIAKCESGLHQFNSDGSVLRGRVNPKDVGLFQLNEKYHLNQSIKLGYDIYTPAGNIAYAKWLYQSQGTAPWNWSKSCWG